MSRQRTVTLGLKLTLLLLMVCLTMSSAIAQESPDIEELLAAAIEAGEGEDRAAWAEHAFKRHVLRQKLDADDVVTWRQEMIFQITPTADGFDETLLEMDGRPATAAEVKEHKEAGKFQAHYEKTSELALENPFGADLALLPLLYDQEHEYVGLEKLDGTPCHRIRWQAREESRSLPWQEKLKHAMKGTLCVAADDPDLIHADMETIRPLKKGPVKIALFRIAFEAQRVGEAWLPSRLETVSHTDIPGKKYRTHNVYRYTDYRKP